MNITKISKVDIIVYKRIELKTKTSKLTSNLDVIFRAQMRGNQKACGRIVVDLNRVRGHDWWRTGGRRQVNIDEHKKD